MKYYNLYVEGTNDLYTYSDERNEYNVGDIAVVDFRYKERMAIVVAEAKDENFKFKVLNIKRKAENSFSYEKSYIDLLLWVKKYYVSSYSSVFTMLNSKKTKVKYIEQYRLLEKNLDDTLESKNLKKYFKKKTEIKTVFFNKKYTKDEINIFLEKKYIVLEKIVQEGEKIYFEDSLGKDELPEKTELNCEQLEIKNNIEKDPKKYFLLRGVTGSGKTEIYLALIREAFEKGKGAIFLVPEISLTPQMVKRFKKEFGENMAILHSRMTDKERSKEWQEIGYGNKRVVLGVRSAIFAPVKNLAYIVIDEEHEATYKQDNNPRYHAKMVAIKRVELEGAKLVLGSATPSVESYYYAEKNVFQLNTIENRFNGAELPKVEIVDMTKEENQYFSKTLLLNIKETLLKKEQVILLLNRKGYSTYIQCKDCGYVEECQHCSIKYSYYQKEAKFRCNYCGTTKKYTGTCSSCHGKNLTHSGTGVEKVEEELKKIFPVEMIRVDSEASKEKDFHQNMYEDFLKGKYSIMIGTQMITKGLHFPNVTLVGVINADTSLSIPDFRSGEKTFQLLTQVSGRAGRGEKAGKVIIQTYQKENKILEKVIEADYLNFYKYELEERRCLEYPPFSKMINIGISSSREIGLEEFCKNVYNSIVNDKVEIYGPMKSLVYKVKDRYRYNILIKGTRENVNRYKIFLEKQLENFKENKNFRIVVDVDPVNLI
ncbi:MAG: replication restart helicase PriA [Fusobacteriaceae bacterium]